MRTENLNSFGLSARDMKTIESILNQFPEIKQIQVFGSRANGSYKPGSDIDFVILDEELNDRRLMKLKEAFDESSLPFHVDIIHYPALTNEELKKHIDRVGVPIF
ncbi:MAG: nucleotidyltransferase domain-containing protein [Bacteroidota bacterium]|nr:nucleotidyltransferase domain-containing protein [Bacteroidota bacterium]